MKQMYITLVRTDEVKVELDEKFFTEEWFKDFRGSFYDYYDLEEIAEYIVYNVVHNNSTYIDGIGTPLRDGERPYWIKEEDPVNKHVNVIYNSYDTEVEYE